MKLRLQPIPVFCFHQVSKTYDPSTMLEGDWTEINRFKRNIIYLQSQYTFISLPEAHDKMKNDIVRRKKYAVLTADDGWASLKEILPWLHERQIPITLFINPAYLDGKHFRKRPTEKYILQNELRMICDNYLSMTIGMHGFVHIDASEQSMEEFIENVQLCNEALRNYPQYIPYYAYVCGHRCLKHDELLNSLNITPLLIRGKLNYNNDKKLIDRIAIDGCDVRQIKGKINES